MMYKFTKKEVHQIYQFLTSPNVDALSEKAQEEVVEVRLQGPELEALKKIANHCSLAEFESFIESNDVPPIKLDDRELELIKGGGLASWLYKAFKKALERYIKDNPGGHYPLP